MRDAKPQPSLGGGKKKKKESCGSFTGDKIMLLLNEVSGLPREDVLFRKKKGLRCVSAGEVSLKEDLCDIINATV